MRNQKRTKTEQDTCGRFGSLGPTVSFQHEKVASSKRGENPDRNIRWNELVATLKELYKNECNLGSLDDPVLTGFSEEDSEEAGDGVVVEGSDWEAFGDEAEMASRAEPEW